MTWDGYDQELLDNFQALSPLLKQASAYKRSKDEERQTKRHKLEAKDHLVKTEESGPESDALTALRQLAQLVLSHERALQNLAKQNSFVMFISNSPQGALPLLATLADAWKRTLSTAQSTPPKQTLRTQLLQGLIKELLQRVQKLSVCKVGDMLWDTALQKGTIREDGSWPYMKWSPEEQKLIPANRAPIPMARLMKDLQYLDELLEDSTHVVRFHNLKPQQEMTPWLLQVSLRDSEVWRLMTTLCQSSTWVLLGMQVKIHSQTLSRPAQAVQHLFGKGAPQTKGTGKGQKGKAKK